MKTIAPFLLFTLCGSAFAATVSNVIVRQHWPWETKATIEFTLSDVSLTSPVDVAITAYDGDTKLEEIPIEALTPAPRFLSASKTYQVTFDPSRTSFGNRGVVENFNVGVTCAIAADYTNKLYMVVDLTSASNVTYLTGADIVSGNYGAYEFSPPSWVHTDLGYWTNTFSPTVIWTGVTNNPVYATTKLVMRRIPAGSFLMGSPTNEVGYRSLNENYRFPARLTQDYYLGVFELTKAQYSYLMQTGSSSDTLPQANLSYAAFRGDRTNETGSASSWCWPACGHTVDPASKLAAMRSYTGIDFDLPTEAQWEYACRAGTVGAWNNGTTITNTGSEVASYDVNGNMLGYCSKNSGQSKHTVGRLLANAWGLYDMHGNIQEAVVDVTSGSVKYSDLYGASPSLVTDPAGCRWQGLKIIYRGGNYQWSYPVMRAGYRDDWIKTTTPYDYSGFRLWAPAN